MSKKQKKEKIIEIKKMLADANFAQDYCGNYESPKATSRVILKKVNIRFERKYSFGWGIIFSLPIITFSIDRLRAAINQVVSHEKRI